jgi:HD-GYP domain-containing protein (c-di-GMP phosphodiesterase class II)
LTLLVYGLSVALWTQVDFGDFMMGDFLAALVILIGLAAKTLFTDRAQRRLFETSELLRQSYTMVEQQVRERTTELQVTNTQLTAEIAERKGAEKKLEYTLESLRKSMSTTIQVMVSTVEVRDPYTAGHQLKSANLARAIATEMGLPPEKIEGIRMAGSIHDLGKISIPAEILSKPTKLSEIEFSLIKEHARRGFEMLKDVESPWPLAEIVYQHHERMDGSGYPRNLKGDEICLEARILTVADVVEAMASHRPYRPGLGIDSALAEIKQNRGIFYDDSVADACLRLFREKGFKLEGT